MKPILVRMLSRVVFFLGACTGLALAVLMIWNRVEAIHYFFDGANYEPFNGLRCPMMMAPTEEGVVTAVFHNPTNKEINFLYRAQVSGSVSARQLEGRVTVPAHETRRVLLSIDANDVDLQFFIFVKMNILPNTLHPSQQAVCGIMVREIPGLSGKQIPAAALSLSFLGMAIGLGVRPQAGSKGARNTIRVMKVLGSIVLLTLFFASIGWWLVGMAFAALTILLMLISIRLAIA